MFLVRASVLKLGVGSSVIKGPETGVGGAGAAGGAGGAVAAGAAGVAGTGRAAARGLLIAEEMVVGFVFFLPGAGVRLGVGEGLGVLLEAMGEELLGKGGGGDVSSSEALETLCMTSLRVMFEVSINGS